jgi:Leucine-rich repeat (LRR) protein
MKPFLVLLLPLVLVGCGPEPPASQAEAVAAIKKLGGYVTLDKTSGEVVEVYVNRTQITDAGLEHLKGLTSLTTLGLRGPQITDAGLEHLKGLTSLTTLYLDGPQITDAGLEHLKRLTSLTTLDLRSTQITDAGLAEIKAALPKCSVGR